MEELPAELTIDILSRLPRKTIINGKLVCKKWRNLVSDSLFVNLHLYCICRTRYRLSPSDTGTMKWVQIEDKVDHHDSHHDCLLSRNLNLAPILRNTWKGHMGSVNGLICLRHSSLEPNLDDIYICNPVTTEYMRLPRQRYQRDGFPGVVYGFGVSSLMGEYKVVRAFQEKTFVQNGDKPARPSVLEVGVYTLGTGQWRSLGPVPVTYWLKTSHQFYGAPFLNNHCHWIVSDSKDANDKIATFDLDKETFQLFPSPPESVQGKRCYGQSLGILKGCLCKLDTYHSELNIWVMKEYGINNSWHKQVVNRTTQWPLYQPIYLIAGLKDGSILMISENQNQLFVFDPRSQTIQDPKMFDCRSHVLAYRPSFLKLRNFGSENHFRIKQSF